MENKERCENCGFRYRLVKFDYTNGGCEHTPMDGHICMVFGNEGEAVWMVGTGENAMCEAFIRRKDG